MNSSARLANSTEPGAGAVAPDPAGAVATASNTAYVNSIGTGEEGFRLLLRGIDSLYAKYATEHLAVAAARIEKRSAEVIPLVTFSSRLKEIRA